MSKYTRLMVLVIICILVAIVLSECISKPALINVDKLPNNGGGGGGLLGNASGEQSMVGKLLNMFWFMCILNIMLTWIAVLWLKRIIPWVKAWWLSIIVNILILGVWELCIWLKLSPAHWQDVFIVSLVSWYAQAKIYDKLNLKDRLNPKIDGEIWLRPER